MDNTASSYADDDDGGGGSGGVDDEALLAAFAMAKRQLELFLQSVTVESVVSAAKTIGPRRVEITHRLCQGVGGLQKYAYCIRTAAELRQLYRLYAEYVAAVCRVSGAADWLCLSETPALQAHLSLQPFEPAKVYSGTFPPRITKCRNDYKERIYSLAVQRPVTELVRIDMSGFNKRKSATAVATAASRKRAKNTSSTSSNHDDERDKDDHSSNGSSDGSSVPVSVEESGTGTRTKLVDREVDFAHTQHVGPVIVQWDLSAKQHREIFVSSDDDDDDDDDADVEEDRANYPAVRTFVTHYLTLLAKWVQLPVDTSLSVSVYGGASHRDPDQEPAYSSDDAASDEEAEEEGVHRSDDEYCYRYTIVMDVKVDFVVQEMLREELLSQFGREEVVVRSRGGALHPWMPSRYEYDDVAVQWPKVWVSVSAVSQSTPSGCMDVLLPFARCLEPDAPRRYTPGAFYRQWMVSLAFTSSSTSSLTQSQSQSQTPTCTFLTTATSTSTIVTAEEVFARLLSCTPRGVQLLSTTVNRTAHFLRFENLPQDMYIKCLQAKNMALSLQLQQLQQQQQQRQLRREGCLFALVHQQGQQQQGQQQGQGQQQPRQQISDVRSEYSSSSSVGVGAGAGAGAGVVVNKKRRMTTFTQSSTDADEYASQSLHSQSQSQGFLAGGRPVGLNELCLTDDVSSVDGFLHDVRSGELDMNMMATAPDPALTAAAAPAVATAPVTRRKRGRPNEPSSALAYQLHTEESQQREHDAQIRNIYYDAMNGRSPLQVFREDIQCEDDLRLAINQLFAFLEVEYRTEEIKPGACMLTTLREYCEILHDSEYASNTYKARQLATALKGADRYTQRMFWSWVLLKMVGTLTGSGNNNEFERRRFFSLENREALCLEWVAAGTEAATNASASADDDDEDNNDDDTEMVAATGRKPKRQRDTTVWTWQLLVFVAKQHNPEACKKIQERNVDDILQQCIKMPTDYNKARLLYALFADMYLCSDLCGKSKLGSWWRYEDHRWVYDKKVTLMTKLSEDIAQLFTHESNKLYKEKMVLEESQLHAQQTRVTTLQQQTAAMTAAIQAQRNAAGGRGTGRGGRGGRGGGRGGGRVQATASVDDQTTTDEERIQNEMRIIDDKCTAIHGILMSLGNNGPKQAVMREATQLFFDANFESQRDENKWLLGCPNGVLDMRTGEFRAGRPTDYITMTTGTPYVPFESFTESQHAAMEDVKRFMSQVYPEPELCTFMWNHLGAALIGQLVEQALYIYIGNGCNGKSMVEELMAAVLGDYKGVIPVELMSNKRPGIGSVSPEIIALKGLRLAYGQELSKNTSMNDGFVKQMTGGNKIQGRGLYIDIDSFFPQFTPAICTNNEPIWRTNDDGVWRRAMYIHHKSKFAYQEEIDAKKFEKEVENPAYIFLRDPVICQRFDEWRVVMLTELFRIAFVNQGRVPPCAQVLETSRKYRLKLDLIGRFINDTISETTPADETSYRAVGDALKAWNQMHNMRVDINDVEEEITKRFTPLMNTNPRHKKLGGVWRGFVILQLEAHSHTDTAATSTSTSASRHYEEDAYPRLGGPVGAGAGAGAAVTLGMDESNPIFMDELSQVLSQHDRAV